MGAAGALSTVADPGARSGLVHDSLERDGRWLVSWHMLRKSPLFARIAWRGASP